MDDPKNVIPDNWRFLDLKEILESPTTIEPPWRVRGLVAEGCGTQVSAHPHGMKSYTWLQASIESAVQQMVWGHFKVQQVKRTLYLETEDPEWLLKQRVKHLAKGLDIRVDDIQDAGCFVLGCLGPFDLVKMEKVLKQAIDHFKPDFTVLSTLQGLLAGRDWGQQSDMAPVNALLTNISTNYSPLVTITHSPWDKKQKRAAGTVTQAANFPTTCHYQKYIYNGETFASVIVDSKLGSDEGSANFKLKLINGEPDSIRFQYQKSAQKREIVEHIQAHPKETAADIASMFDITDRYARKLRKEALDG